MPTNDTHNIVYVIGVKGTETISAVSQQFLDLKTAEELLPRFEQDFETYDLEVKQVPPKTEYQMASQGSTERK